MFDRFFAHTIACIAVLIPAATASAQSVPDSIAAEGVPAIPPELVAQLNRYQNFRQASFQDWLGDKREMLVLTRFADTNQVHRVSFPGGDRQQVTFLPERVLEAQVRPHHAEFLIAMDEGGAENYQLFLDDPATGTIERLSDGHSRHTAPRWSHSGRLLAYSSNARNGKDMDLYVVDPADTKSARRLKEVSGDWYVSDWSPDDRHVAAIERISINESYVSLLDVASGDSETITAHPSGGPTSTVAYENVRYSKDGKALYWTTDLDSEFLRLQRFDLDTKATSVLSAEIPWDVSSFELSDDGRTIVLVANEDGFAIMHVLDAASGRERPAPEIPSGQISGLAFRRDSQEVGFTLGSARATPDAYSYDVASGRLERWTKSEAGGLDTYSFALPELVHYPTFDGREIAAFVYRAGPKFKAPHPVLIDIHGGPEGQFRPGFLGPLNYLINELGITLVFPNVRGSSGYGKSYLKLDNGFRREDSVKDIGALLDWIGTRRDLDSSRMVVYGGSYGGYMSLATMTHYSDRLKAGIELVGISNFLTFLKNTQSYRRDLRRVEYGDERDPKMKEFLQQISPLTSIQKITKPMLVVAGKNDPRVPASESDQVVAELRKSGLPVWYVVGKNEGHGFAKKKNQDYLQWVQILFLKRYLLGEGS